jgi:hypothetical protein
MVVRTTGFLDFYKITNLLNILLLTACKIIKYFVLFLKIHHFDDDVMVNKIYMRKY